MSQSSGRLHGQVAVITGASQGFGRAILETFVAQGAKVLNMDITVKSDDYLATQAGGSKHDNDGGESAFQMKGDVTKIADWERAVKLCKEKFGDIPSIIVNNAGWTYSNKATLDVTEDEFDRVFAINVKSIYNSVQAVVPHLIEGQKGGAFIQISSTAALRPRPKLVWYNASKGAVSTASKAMALEYAPHKIRFNCLNPVAGNTPLLSKFAGAKESGDVLTAEQLKQFNESVPLGRLSEPSDVANAALFLADPASHFITGIDLPVDGGRCV